MHYEPIYANSGRAPQQSSKRSQGGREGTVNNEQVWGLPRLASVAVCLGVDMCREHRLCMVGIGACNKYTRDAMVTGEEMSNDLGSSYQPVQVATVHPCHSSHTRTGSLPPHISASCETEQHNGGIAKTGDTLSPRNHEYHRQGDFVDVRAA